MNTAYEHVVALNYEYTKTMAFGRRTSYLILVIV